MNKQDYHNSIAVDITPNEALENIKNVSGWWAKNFEGRCQETGDEFTVTFGKTWVTFTVTELIENERMVWLVKDCYLDWLNDKKEWHGTRVIFDITTEDGVTLVAMEHEGLVPQAECWNDCKKGWDFYIQQSLFKHLAQHEGVPA